MNKRIKKLRQYMKNNDYDGVIVTDSKNMLYFSGFTGGEGYLLITAEKCILATDFRYTEQAELQAHDFSVADIFSFDLKRELSDLRQIGFENYSISYSSYVNFSKITGNLKPMGYALTDIRAVKDSEEIQRIKTAEHIGDEAFKHILSYIRPGVSERDIAFEIEFFMRRNGAEALSFDTIAAAGAHGAMPHAEPGERVVAEGDFIVLDFGCVYEGYCSDMTRTVCVGKATDEMKNVYNTVLKAQTTALSMIKEGAIPSEIHNAAQAVTDAAYPKAFGHSLGHGVGLNIHERPVLSPKNNVPLVNGNVVTVEPGIYLRGFCGVRIEDLVVVDGENALNLTNSDKNLIEL